MTPSIDSARLWRSIMAMAEIGPTPEGGSCRLALSAEDAAARGLLAQWGAEIGLTLERDAIGNMFLRRAGTDAAAPAVAFGSHLDTVPTGGRFDGVFGVLAGLEVLRALHGAGVRTRAPLELVNWTNEEGSRFRPAMLGSRVFAGQMTLAGALAIADDGGITVAQALRDTAQAGDAVTPRGWQCWIEAHIEQGPVLEATGTDIGIVTGAMHARYYRVTVTGEPSHVGPTAMGRRRDSLAAASEVVLLLERIGLAGEPGGRATASWILNTPNALGNVPHITRLHCDVRHEDTTRATAMDAEFRAGLSEIAARRQVRIDADQYAGFGPLAFDAGLCGVLRGKAEARQLSTRNMVALAGHDSMLVAPLCPSAMLFVPSVDGITHNPAEYSTPEHLANGAQVLLDAVMELAG